jgi:hypothetical protein
MEIMKSNEPQVLNLLEIMKRQVFPRGPFSLASACRLQVASHTGRSSSSRHPLAAKVVARVNGAVLTDADLVREEYSIFPYARSTERLPKELEPQIRDGAMKMIVFEELVYQEAHCAQDDSPARQDAARRSRLPQAVCHAGRVQCAAAERVSRLATVARAKIRRSLLIEAFLKPK